MSSLLHNLPLRADSEKGGLVFHLIPHTHWDREWYLPLGALRTRLVRMVDDLLDRLNREPEYRSFFLDGQAVLLEDYLAIRPERRVEVEAAVREGRLGTGPWYVLADELVPSGEALLRNLLLGGSVARRLGPLLPVAGKRCRLRSVLQQTRRRSRTDQPEASRGRPTPPLRPIQEPGRAAAGSKAVSRSGPWRRWLVRCCP